MAEVASAEPPHENGHPPPEEQVSESPDATITQSHHRAESTATSHSLSHSSILASPQPKPRRPSTVDRDAQEMVIDSLRMQIQDLISQVSQLNTKLVNSYDRVSDLEDDLHVASSSLRSSTLKISQLELERTQHLSALNTGLLVEKSHVTTELNRLMEKATEEAAQRGQAESARMAIEKDLDDLSASLFGQANAMVAEARFEKHLSERKVEDAERALKSAEEAVQVMQAQMQTMQGEREDAEKRAREMEVAMGKGKWVARREERERAVSLRLFSVHTPYLDYLAFIAHLRVLHPSSPSATPAMSTLLQLPFLVRLMTEDSEPTVRLDLAPSLNWLSRRSVLSAIHSGQLTIEPIPASSLFSPAESSTYPSSSTTIAGMNSTGDNVSCALCGTPIFPVDIASDANQKKSVSLGSTSATSSSWSGATAFFKKAGVNVTGTPSSPTHRRTSPLSSSNTQIFIFRLASSPSSGIAIASLPLPSLTKSSSQSTAYSANSHSHTYSYGNGVPSSSSSSMHTHAHTGPSSSSSSSVNINGTHYSSPNFLSNTTPSLSHAHSGISNINTNLNTTNITTNSQPTTIYPLCQSGWCLNRLRTTCTLWAYVRTGIVDKVWEEELPLPPPYSSHSSSSSAAAGGLNGSGSVLPLHPHPHHVKSQGQVLPPEHLPPSSLSNGNGKGEKPPPVPPRKRGLWGIASAIGERAASWGSAGSGGEGKEGKEVKEGKVEMKSEGKEGKEKPPQHPSLNQEKETRRLPPPLPPSTSSSTNASAPPPPPLPKRSEGRGRSRTPQPSQVPAADAPTDAEGTEATGNADTDADVSSTQEPSTTFPTTTSTTTATTTSNTPPPPPPLPPRSHPPTQKHTRTPSTVPLPDSRPGTPSAPVSASAQSVVQPLSRATSPLGGAASVGGIGGASPPPIPRRAAARVRGSTPAPASAPITEKKDESEETAAAVPPAPGAVVPTVDVDKDKDVDADAENKEDKADEKKEKEESETKEKDVDIAAAAVTDADADVDTEADVFVDAPTPAPGQEPEGVSADAAPVPVGEEKAEEYAAVAEAGVMKEGGEKAEEKNGDEEPKEEVKEEKSKEEEKKEEKEEKPTPTVDGPGGESERDKDLSEAVVGDEYVHVNGAEKEKEKGVESTADINTASAEEKEEEKGDEKEGEVGVKDQEEEAREKELKEREDQERKEKERGEKERKQKEKEKEEEEKSKAGFVGDDTWEERTWKEIVRLREDMFWARVGGLRE